MTNKLDSIPGQAVYTPLTIKVYDIVVLTVSNRLAWKCPTDFQLDFFNQNISTRHLDVGVGSGYYMNHCSFPSQNEVELTLMDLNIDCLNYCADKLSRYKPTLIRKDILQPFNNKENKKYDSISINYVLHCLPGNLKDKQIVFENLKQLLRPDGIIFGSTILGDTTQANWLANKLLKVYNKKQIFCNMQDSKTELEQILRKNFKMVEIKQVGMVALFKASLPL